jgi:NAD(P)H-flavin reductase
MLFFILIHPLQIGSILNSNSFVLYYWYFLVSVAILSVLIKIVDIFNLSFRKTKVIDISFYPGDIYIIKYKFNEELPYLFPGQYFYIKNNFFGEAHPFSVLDFDFEAKTISFGIKNLGKFTKYLMNTKVGDSHYLDGPFGEFTVQAQNEDPKIILAGGIGITPFYRLIKDFGNENTYLFYANQKIDYALYRDKFKDLLKGNYYDFISHEKLNGKNIICDFITTDKIKEIASKFNNENVNYLICGSPMFTKAMLGCLEELKVPKNNILIEEFEY